MTLTVMVMVVLGKLGLDMTDMTLQQGWGFNNNTRHLFRWTAKRESLIIIITLLVYLRLVKLNCFGSGSGSFCSCLLCYHTPVPSSVLSVLLYYLVVVYLGPIVQEKLT